MRLYLTPKKVLRISNKAKSFLHGLTANEMDKPRNAFLNIHGRIIAVFDQILMNEDVCLICLEEAYVDAALEHLGKYAKLSGARLDKKGYLVYFDLDSVYEPGENEFSIPQHQGQLILTEKQLPSSLSDREFQWFRLQHHIPLQGVDFTDEMLLNVSKSDYVSFTKGCFLGQEPLSKVYNRSKPTWRLVVKKFEDCSQEEQSKITSKTQDPDSGSLSGFVFEKNQ